MNDLLELMQSLICQHRSVDIAESEFKRMIYDDEMLRLEYRDWCRREGLSERKGYIEYCNRYIEEEESRWEVLDDPDLK